jgi:tetratricopeptide (TPR) repeat protein
MRRVFSGLRAALVAFAMGSSAFAPDGLALAQAVSAPAKTAENSWAEAIRQGGALQNEGEIHGDVKLLTQAAEIFRQRALPLAPRQSRAADWAETQGKLGRAYLCIGALSGNLSYYEEAVSAYRSVLEVRARAASPDEWANAQNNIGGALLGIGKLTAQVPRLQEAEKAFRLALEIYTIDGSPKQWADAQTNLGVTHFLLGDFTGDTAYFASAREELASAQPMLAKPAANGVASILRQIERRIPSG